MKKELQDTAENTWEAMDEEKATGAREICQHSGVVEKGCQAQEKEKNQACVLRGCITQSVDTNYLDSKPGSDTYQLCDQGHVH